MPDSRERARSFDSTQRHNANSPKPKRANTWSGRLAPTAVTRGSVSQRCSPPSVDQTKETPLQSPPGGLHMPSKTISEPNEAKRTWSAVSTSCSLGDRTLGWTLSTSVVFENKAAHDSFSKALGDPAGIVSLSNKIASLTPSVASQRPLLAASRPGESANKFQWDSGAGP